MLCKLNVTQSPVAQHTIHIVRRTLSDVVVLVFLFNSVTHVSLLLCLCILIVCKGKAVPLQAWSGPEGSRKLRFPNFVTTAQDGGKVVSPTHRPPLPAGNTPGTHLC